MNKSALKNFAATARKELMNKVKAKALRFGINEESIESRDIISSNGLLVDGKPLSEKEKIQRNHLLTRIYETGFNQVLDEVAYTWFNCFIVLRFMEVNNYLPTGIRVFSSSNLNSSNPDMINKALELELDIDHEFVYELKVNHQTEELFKYLIIKQCNDLKRYVPFIFETKDYTEFLFPEGLLEKNSFVRQMSNTDIIPEEYWRKVEVMGWLYQYYIALDKKRVIKAKRKYKTEDIPFATQLFTPDWIVRYMVQNSLGRYWVESHPEHRDLLENWDYYLENPSLEEDFEEKLLPYINKVLKVEDIKCFDPAMGSGHILVYLFDVLYEIYSRCGYLEREIPRLIIENNLFGLDIEDRACQLACFSIIMKAMEFNPNFLKEIEKNGLKFHLASIQESNSLSESEIAYMAGNECGEEYENTKKFTEQFLQAKTFGSLIKLVPCNLEHLERRLQHIMEQPASEVIEGKIRERVLTIYPMLIKQFHIMNNTYDVLVSNPPYMGNRYMSKELVEFVKVNYSETKMDLFSAFIEYSFQKVHKNGHLGFMTPFVWMFIGIYEPLRKKIVNEKTISSLVQLEYSAFEDATVPICTFTIRNASIDVLGEFIKLSEFKGSKRQPLKLREAVQIPESHYRYRTRTKIFGEIPGSPIAYWVSDDLREIFKNNSLFEYSISDGQNVTGNNEKYVRYFWEVEKEKTGRGQKWVLYAKGGGFRKWFGNLENVVDWSQEARKHYRKDPICRIIPDYLWYKKGITWGLITSNLPSFRVLPEGTTFDKGGSSIFFDDYSNYYFILALLNSKIFLYLANILNPTLNFQVKDVRAIPIILPDEDVKSRIDSLVKENIQISEEDWNSYEVSYQFSKHPLLMHQNNSGLVSEAFSNWERHCAARFNRLKENEQKINQLILDLYQISEIKSEVVDKDVTVSKADLKREIVSFISYAVGCIFGRYSLDGINNKTFLQNEGPIIPIVSEPFFKDDIVVRFYKFLEMAFGEKNLAENLSFMANVLGKKKGESESETIRRYFVNDFFKNHAHTYKKRPIYWLFTSGKQKAFNCLVYIHRYDANTLSYIRTKYLNQYQILFDAKKKDLLNMIDSDASSKQMRQTMKELELLEMKIEELNKYEDLLHHMEKCRIELDLDDGVAVNYEKFKGLVKW